MRVQDAFTVRSQNLLDSAEIEMHCKIFGLLTPLACASLSSTLIAEDVKAACIRPAGDPTDFCATGRAETGAFLGNRRASDTLFVFGLDDRAAAMARDPAHGLWLRTGVQSFKSTSESGQHAVDARGEFVQLGADFFEWSPPGSAGTLKVGALIGYASARNDATAGLNPFQARGDASGPGGGMYANWYQDRQSRLGFHAEWWGQFGWFDDKVDRQGLRQVDYRSHVGMTSIEVGYAWQLSAAGGWRLEPQGQIVYVHNHAFNVTQSDGAEVDGAKRGGWMSRLGIRASGPEWRPGGVEIHPQATINWWHDQLGDEVAFSNQFAVKDLFPAERLELKAGAVMAFAKRWTAWGDVGVQAGSQSYRAWTAQVGLRYRY
ncbi:MAG: autotransporter outer membrane beta-barrel domain-containing protein [Variovorax sp.]